MTTIKLKPCPFCGGDKAHVNTLRIGSGETEFVAHCPDCCSNGPTAGRTEEAAARLWNKRPDPVLDTVPRFTERGRSGGPGPDARELELRLSRDPNRITYPRNP